MTHYDLERLLQNLIDGLQLAKIDDRFAAEVKSLEKRLYDSFDLATSRLALAVRRGESNVNLSDDSFDDLREVRNEIIVMIRQWIDVNAVES